MKFLFLLLALARLDAQRPQDHYKAALSHRERGETSKAIAELNSALKLQPGFEPARLALGLLLQQQGNVQGAIGQYQTVLKQNPRSADAHNWLGVAYMQTNRLVEAAASFRRAVGLKPDFVRAHNNLGSTLAQAGDLQQGIDAFQAGLKHAPGDLQLRLNLGTALRNKGDSEGAAEQFAFVLKRDPDNPELHHQLGQTLRQKGDVAGAITEFETALALNPEYPDSYYILGQTLRQKAPKLAPDAEADQGRDLARRGDFGAAADLLRRVTARSPNNADARYFLGAALWFGGDKALALQELEESVRLNPANSDASHLLAIAQREAGRLTEARRLLQRTIALNPKGAPAYFDLGVVLLRLNQTQQAIGQFEAGMNLPLTGPVDVADAVRAMRLTVARKPEAEAHNVLGRLLGLAGADPRQVIAEFEAAIRLKPDYAEAHNSLGLVHTQLNQDDKAAAAFREAIRLRPDYAAAHGNLGALLTVTQPSEAVKELEKAVSLQPGLLKAQYNLALAYGGDKEIAQLRKILAAEADYPRAHFSLGKALLRKGAVREALPHLERAAATEPSFGDARYQLGLALTRLGQTERATSEMAKGRELIAAAERDQNLALDLSEGNAAMETREFDQALDRFRRAAALRPDLAEPHYRIGLALRGKGDAAGAQTAFRRALELDPSHAGARQNATPTGDAALIAEVEAQIRDGKFSELEPRLRTLLEQRPQWAWGWYALGYSLYAQRKIGPAIEALSKSLSLDVKNAEAHKVLGRALMIIGRFDVARQEFQQGALHDPKSAEMHYNLGKLYSIQDLWPEARQAFEQALRLNAEFAEAHDGLGFALESLGDDKAAIASYEKAAAINAARGGAFAAPYVNLAALHNRNGNTELALELARKAIGVNPKSDRGWFQAAKAHEKREELQPALDALQRAIAIQSQTSAYYYVLANVLRRLGRQQEAAQALEQFRRLDSEMNKLEQMRREEALK